MVIWEREKLDENLKYTFNAGDEAQGREKENTLHV